MMPSPRALVANGCVLCSGRSKDNPGLALGAALGGYALAGHDKAVLAECGAGLTGFAAWAEQLIAESTGKDGRGILPVSVRVIAIPLSLCSLEGSVRSAC